MNELTKPNAFVFKAFIDGATRVCVCPRIDNKWSERDIVYVHNYDGAFDDVLHEKYFSVLFVGYEKTNDTNGKFTLKNVNAQYIKSDTAIASDMYADNSFFSTIEKGYQHFYEQSITSEREGVGSQTSEQENL